MDLRTVNVTVGTDRPRESARWWAEALGGEIVIDRSEFAVVGLGSGPGTGFQCVAGAKPGRTRLDLLTGGPGKEVDRLVEAGASRTAGRRTGTSAAWRTAAAWSTTDRHSPRRGPAARAAARRPCLVRALPYASARANAARVSSKTSWPGRAHRASLNSSTSIGPSKPVASTASR